MSRGWLRVHLGYLGLLVATMLPMWLMRNVLIEQFNTPEAKAAWLEWRTKTQEDAKRSGPVQRRVVTVDEPPALIILRDYFHAVALTAFAIVTFVYYFIVMLARQRSPRPERVRTL
jgi:hypothetical protein